MRSFRGMAFLHTRRRSFSLGAENESFSVHDLYPVVQCGVKHFFPIASMVAHTSYKLIVSRKIVKDCE